MKGIEPWARLLPAPYWKVFTESFTEFPPASGSNTKKPALADQVDDRNTDATRAIFVKTYSKGGNGEHVVRNQVELSAVDEGRQDFGSSADSLLLIRTPSSSDKDKVIRRGY